MSTAPFHDLRPWLRHLAETDRLTITKPGVKLKHEVAAIAKRLQHDSAVLCPSPDGHDIPVMANLLCHRSWFAEALGVSESDLLERYRTAAENPIACNEVSEAPAQEVVHEEVDINRLLPVPTHNELDSGPYITAALLISRNPRTGEQNVAIHRCQVSGPNRIGLLLLPRHTLAFHRVAEEAGDALDVALVIGIDPLTLLSSQAIAPLGQDELEIAGALHGRSLDVVKCRSNEVRVPANSEIVLEGRLLPKTFEPEGPFGEFPQYYGARSNQHVIEVDVVTHRRNPIFHTILGGGMEHLLLGAVPREATVLSLLKRSFPNVRDVHLTQGGVCRYDLVVKIEKRSEGEAKNVILGAFGAHYDIKHVTVVDTDVDIHNPNDVKWAVSTRFQADRDLVVVSGAQGSKLDPSTDKGVSAKMGLDATIPLEADEFTFKRIRVPGEDEVDLDALAHPDSASLVTQMLGD
ncbi:UbiD family decarboxylase [Tepidamorphus sp. 3E244]|uniref:UbiD family decarboxylase n=1 Tax=Tepidamorphus sp. 3E244 TaxID=3385498 RepID=UPI0038FD07AF